MDQNVVRLLAAAAANHGLRPAIVDRELAWSYSALSARAGAFAVACVAEGVRPGMRVAVLLERGVDAAAAVFGVQATGAVAVIVNDRLRARQAAHILDDSGAHVLVTTAGDLERVGLDPSGCCQVLDPAGIPAEAELRWIPRDPTDLAQLIYTSGSSGLPKGVMHTHGSISAGVRTVTGYLGLVPADRVASLLALSSVYGLNQLLCSVSVGAALVAIRSPLAADIVAAMRESEVTVAAGVPPLWLQLLSVPGFQQPLRSLRQVQNAGGHLPVEAVRRMRAAQPQADLVLQYGMTETWRSTFLAPAEVDRRPGSMGRPMPGVELLVVGEGGQPVDAGETGELVHAGPTIATGYWNSGEASASVFRPHPVRSGERAVFSGDFVRADRDGFLYFVGRHDRLIKTMGHRVGPDEIVDVLHASGQVREAVVAQEEDAERGQRIVAWVVLADGGTIDQIRRHFRAELPPYMQPARVSVCEHLPRLPSGKYDVNGLRGEPRIPSSD